AATSSGRPRTRKGSGAARSFPGGHHECDSATLREPSQRTRGAGAHHGRLALAREPELLEGTVEAALVLEVGAGLELVEVHGVSCTSSGGWRCPCGIAAESSIRKVSVGRPSEQRPRARVTGRRGRWSAVVFRCAERDNGGARPRIPRTTVRRITPR